MDKLIKLVDYLERAVYLVVSHIDGFYYDDHAKETVVFVGGSDEPFRFPGNETQIISSAFLPE